MEKLKWHLEIETKTLTKTNMRINTSRPEPGKMLNRKCIWVDEKTRKFYGLAEMCQYTYQRGDNKGEYCGEPIQNGNEWCCRLHTKYIGKVIAGSGVVENGL